MPTRDEILWHLAVILMAEAGLNEADKEASPIEWDLDTKDSQLSLAYEVAELIYDEIVKLTGEPESLVGGLGNYTTFVTPSPTFGGGLIPPTPYWWPYPIPTEDPEDVTTVNGPDPTVHTFVNITHRLSDNPTLGEVREWVEKAQLLGLSDDEHVTGYLHTNISLFDVLVEYNPDTAGAGESQKYTIYLQPLNDD